MSELRKGDHVRGTFEGDIYAVYPSGAVRVIDANDKWHDTWRQNCTVIEKPIQEGDQIEDLEQFRRLPVGSVVRSNHRPMFIQKYSISWYTPGLEAVVDVRRWWDETGRDAIVMYIPESV